MCLVIFMAADSSMYVRGRDGKGLIFHELLEALEEENEMPEYISIFPPEEPPDADTDKDSDFSDEEVAGDTNHLPGRILRSQVSVKYSHEIKAADDTNNVSQPSTSRQNNISQPCNSKCPKSAKRPRLNPTTWKSNIFEFSSKVPEPDNEYRPNVEDLLKETVKSPNDAFRCYFTQDIIEHIVRETNSYAGQKLVHNLNATSAEILTFVAVLLLSGYHPLPCRRLYWTVDEDVHTPIVSNTMRRNRFDELMSFIHLADNQSNDGTDRMYKFRPLLDMLNSAFKQITPGPTVSVDESMIPYYGRHGSKQFIRGKPTRFGYKLWVAAYPSGYIHHVEPYCGSSTRLPQTGLGQGGDVVIGLIDHMQLKKGHRLYFDNLFTSVALLQELSSREIGGTGTLRKNRCNASMKLPEKSAWKKKER
ncbi:piggyBac transposable element-derived protein 3-like [Diabrotica virgifera virgifera]|uniref:PiggyBac transposable element-derived protein domain-containing protein n=1 Tax=Diabrotica virgifera virgifera TaxID=50390 RepID=A0ABM5JHI7_DIAVI|nr:piggyBac transposable element-derived protein 3-like [Diabrotica virgifera virgifera]